jgi:hypothetical protein
MHDPRADRPVATVPTNVLSLPAALCSAPTLRVDGEAEVNQPKGSMLADVVNRGIKIGHINENIMRISVPVICHWCE